MKEKLDRLAEAFVLAEIGDPAAMKELRQRLDDLQGDALHPRVQETLEALIRVADQLISREGSDSAVIWEAVEQGILALQEMAVPGVDAGRISVPSRLLQTAGGSVGTVASGSPAAFSFPTEFDAEILGGFIQEAREHLDGADVQLLALEADSFNLEALHTVFRAFHTIKGAASCLDLGAIQALAHETENLLDLSRRGIIPLADRAIDVVFEAVDAMKRLTAEAEDFLKTGNIPPADPALAGLIVRIRETVALKTGEKADHTPLPVVASPGAQDEEPLPVLEDAPSSPPGAARGSEDRAGMKESVRVDADRLDRLVDLIGELVIAESMVGQSSELRSLASGGVLSKSVSQLDKITRELQEMGMSLRMVPVRPLFQKMARLARDLSHKLGKPIEFVTTGEEIEIDKAIVNCVSDALVHIIRNALDHGIEAPLEREKAGKPAAGRIELRALHREGCIVIEIQDNGRGLDSEAILAKGIEKGIIRNGEGLSEQDIFKLVFLPGFSTAKVVTELSGRGVGLDVVRSSVEALRGRIEVHSQWGRGTTFRLRLPLTLAIIDGMVIRAGRERYVVPTLSIIRLVRPEPGQRVTLMDRDEMLSLQDELVPLFRLGHLLDVAEAGELPGDGVAVVVEDAGRRAALMADEVLGQQQIVIKSLGMDLEGVAGISGGVILPDGQVGLILDVNGLLDRRSAPAGLPVAGGAGSVR